MNNEVQEIVKKLETQSVVGITSAFDDINSIKNFNTEEKIIISEGLISVLYHFQHADEMRTMRAAVQIENFIAGFGNEIIPLLFDEIVEADGESAVYLGKALSKIGEDAYEYLISNWDKYLDDEGVLINLTQVLSYFRVAQIQKAMPLILNPENRKNHRLTSMEMWTVARFMEKSEGEIIDQDLLNKLFKYAFNFLSNNRHMLRKNSVRILGNMWHKRLLSPTQEKKVHCSFLAITGLDGQYTWDDAFIVRSEAEDYLKRYDMEPPPAHQYDQKFLIHSKRLLCSKTYHIVLEAPFIARKIQAGQFIIVRPHVSSERIPLSICDWDRKNGTLSIVVSAVGRTSTEIIQMKEGDEFKDVVGPLGERSRLTKTKGVCVVIGGGYGSGAIVPTAKDLKSIGNKVIGIIGARDKENIIMVEELKKACDEVYLTTNDGSAGKKGFVTDALKEVLASEDVNHVLAVGPVPMMNAVCQLTKPLGIETFVSLNAIMVDGTGMCGACRVSIGKETKFACIDGPDFDGHLVDFDNLMKRQKMFLKEEKIAMNNLENLTNTNHE